MTAAQEPAYWLQYVPAHVHDQTVQQLQRCILALTAVKAWDKNAGHLTRTARWENAVMPLIEKALDQ